MKFLLTVFLFLSSFVCFSQEVLWIGNSYTGINRLDQIWMKMAWEDGYRPNVNLRVVGSSTMKIHANSPETMQILTSKPWDIVIIQPNGIETARPWDTVLVNTLPYLRALDSIAKSQNVCAKTFIYQPFGRYDGIDFLCNAGDSELCEYINVQNRTIQHVQQLSEIINTPVVPVGEAFRKHFLAGNPYGIWDEDSLHSTYAGSFLAAAVFYEKIFNRNVTSNTYKSGVSAIAATGLKLLAHQIVGVDPNLPSAFFPTPTVNNEMLTTNLPNSFEGDFNWVFETEVVNNLASVSLEVNDFGIHPLTLNCVSPSGCLLQSRTKLVKNYDYCIGIGKTAEVFISNIKLGLYENTSGNDFGAHFFNEGPESFSGTQLAIALTPGYRADTTFQKWAVWIDFDQNGIFGALEQVLLTPQTKGQFIGSIKLKEGLEEGAYRLRIKTFAPTDPNGGKTCTEGYTGETEDYVLQIVNTYCASPTLNSINVLQTSPDSILVVWPHQNGVKEYHFRYGLNAVNNPLTAIPTQQPLLYLSNLLPGQQYRYKIRSVCYEDSITGYGESWSYFTKQPVAPSCGKVLNSAVVLLDPISVDIYWPYMTGATKYKIRYKKATDVAWSVNSAFLTNKAKLTGLKPITNYQYQIAAFCTTTNTWHPEWSAIYNFKTAGDGFTELVAQANEHLSFSIYPNPSFYDFTLNLETTFPKSGSIFINNLVGQTVYKQTEQLASYDFHVNAENLMPGIYQIVFIAEDGKRFATLWTKE